MNARKLKSGKWEARAYDYQDVYGKQHTKSFVANTKQEAELLAIKFSIDKEAHASPERDYTFKQAFDKYMESRSNTLSPSTIRSHKSKWKNFEPIQNIKLCKINSSVVQTFVNDLAETLSPKSVKNLYSIITSIMGAYCPDTRIKVVLPKIPPVKYKIPSESDIKALIDAVKNTEMEIPILLGAFGMMRQGEICAFSKKDLTGNVLHVSKNMVLNDKQEYVIKMPKTKTSDRYVDLPPFVADKIREMPYDTIKLNPKQIQGRFTRLLTKYEIPHFRFHDLRHYSASMYHALGIPDSYIMAQGGWSSDGVLKNVYRHALDDERKKMDNIANSHFEKLYNENQD